MWCIFVRIYANIYILTQLLPKRKGRYVEPRLWAPLRPKLWAHSAKYFSLISWTVDCRESSQAQQKKIKKYKQPALRRGQAAWKTWCASTNTNSLRQTPYFTVPKMITNNVRVRMENGRVFFAEQFCIDRLRWDAQSDWPSESSSCGT